MPEYKIIYGFHDGDNTIEHYVTAETPRQAEREFYMELAQKAHVIHCEDLSEEQDHSAAKEDQRNARLYACPTCGCTDVQYTCWVEANYERIINDEPPTDYAYCPQCEVNGDEPSMRTGDFVLADTPRPFTNAEREPLDDRIHGAARD